MVFPFPLLGGIFLGWSLGANNASNFFGTAVASRIITFRRAYLLCGGGIILGAVLQGRAGLQTLSSLAGSDLTSLVIISLAAALTNTMMTFLRLPISTSQAVIGAIVGVGLTMGKVHWSILTKVIICWIATPIGAIILACLVYWLLGMIISHVPMSMLTRDKILWSGLIIMGVYGSYALGANNVANATGIFSGRLPGISDGCLLLIGGAAIILGVFTYSKRVMLTVGSDIMTLDAFTALVAVTAMAITVHIFAFVGVPVSSSQAVVGAIIGISFMRGVRAIHFRTLRNIGFGWFMTPIIALILSAAGQAIIAGMSKV